MAGADATAKNQADEYIERANALANSAISKIIESRDSVKRDINEAKSQVDGMVDKIDKAIKRYDKRNSDLSALADKAAALQARLDSVESLLGEVEESAGAIAGMIGKVVNLKSNPEVKMTAASVENDGNVLCVWMQDGRFVESTIPFAALEVVAPAADKFTDDEVRAMQEQSLPPLKFKKIASFPSSSVEQEGGAK